MTASSTQVSLANRSLLSFGARATIASFTEQSTEAQAVSVFFQSTFEQLARTARWGCLRKEAELSLIGAAAGTPENPLGTTLPIPPLPWLYSYAMPSDSLFIRGLIPSIPTTSGSIPLTPATLLSPTNLPNSGQIPFKVSYSTDNAGNPIEIILCNLTQAQAVYTVNQSNPVIWDSLFEQGFVSALAAFLIPAISLNLPLLGASIKSAEACIMAARIADGNETPVSQDRQADWISARMAGTLINRTSSNNQYSEYPGMNWPSGYNAGANIS